MVLLVILLCVPGEFVSLWVDLWLQNFVCFKHSEGFSSVSQVSVKAFIDL